MAILSIPRPNAKPEYLFGSILQLLRTLGLTMPHPKISNHLSPNKTSTSADGSVNGKKEGLNLNFASSPKKTKTCQ